MNPGVFLNFCVEWNFSSAMSEYSLDSLESIENIEEDSLEKSASLNDEDNIDDDACNLRAVKSAKEFVQSYPSYIDSTLTTPAWITGIKVK